MSCQVNKEKAHSQDILLQLQDHQNNKPDLSSIVLVVAMDGRVCAGET